MSAGDAGGRAPGRLRTLRRLGVAALALVTATLATGCGSGNADSLPAAPSAAQPAPKPVPLTAEFSSLLRSSQPKGSYFPAHLYYTMCGNLRFPGPQPLIYWRELVIEGPDGDYIIEQDYDNLVPRKTGGGGTTGCGIARARDYDLTHTAVTRARLIVHYTLDDGDTGTVEAIAAKLDF